MQETYSFLISQCESLDLSSLKPFIWLFMTPFSLAFFPSFWPEFYFQQFLLKISVLRICLSLFIPRYSPSLPSVCHVNNSRIIKYDLVSILNFKHAYSSRVGSGFTNVTHYFSFWTCMFSYVCYVYSGATIHLVFRPETWSLHFYRFPFQLVFLPLDNCLS